jgi:hypothetical protein
MTEADAADIEPVARFLAQPECFVSACAAAGRVNAQGPRFVDGIVRACPRHPGAGIRAV